MGAEKFARPRHQRSTARLDDPVSSYGLGCNFKELSTIVKMKITETPNAMTKSR